MGRHVMEALGMSRVVIEDGKVTEVGEPKVGYCPLFKKYRNIDRIDADTVRENIEFRIREFGMCTEMREIRMRDFLSFGVSEMMAKALADGELDAVVLASDGCGTAVIDDPEIVQGMGGRISGLCETSPIGRVIDGIGRERVLDPEKARIDQMAGVRKALEMGYRRIAVTVASAGDAEGIRRLCGDGAVIFAVHTTGVSEEDARSYFATCDVITACASRYVREVAAERGALQAGTKVPVYGASDTGRRIIISKMEELGRTPDNVLEDGPRPLL